MSTSTNPRVWLVADIDNDPAPADQPVVCDNQIRVWHPGTDGRYHTPDGLHHATWDELHARYDLVEVVTR